jgi:hypothetical protein
MCKKTVEFGPYYNSQGSQSKSKGPYDAPKGVRRKAWQAGFCIRTDPRTTLETNSKVFLVLT